VHCAECTLTILTSELKVFVQSGKQFVRRLLWFDGKRDGEIALRERRGEDLLDVDLAGIGATRRRSVFASYKSAE